MRELESFGCFEAVYDGVCPELKEALFGQAIGQLFVLPRETKRQNGSNKPHQGYIGQIPTMTYARLLGDGAPNLEKVEEFARLMWPQGDPNFWLASNYINCTRRQVPSLEEGRSLLLQQIKKTLMGSGEKTQLLQIPKVDFRGLDPCNPGGDGWESVRVQAMRALESFGCLEAIYDGVSPELKEALFGRAMGELFALPLETKIQSASDKPYQGYIGQIPTMAYESLRVDGAPDLEKVQEFARLMWPQGNPNFCQTVWNFAKQVQKLEQMVERMVLQSLGVDKYWTSHTESLAYGVRLAEYGVPLDQETKIAMGSHLDPNMMTIICQHQVKGLEIQTKDGEWIDVEPFPNSFTVMIGEAFGAWTNGRLQPAHHRVRIQSNQKRHTALFSSRPKDGSMVQILEELIDKEHPLLYKPYNYNDYLKFRFSTERERAEDPLRAFCGIERIGVDA